MADSRAVGVKAITAVTLLLLSACSSSPYQVESCQRLSLHDPLFHALDAHGHYAVSRYLAQNYEHSPMWWEWSAAQADEALAVDGVSRSECAPMNNLPPPEALSSNITYPDEYNISLRFLGLYPLTRIPFGWGVEREIAETHERYRQYQRVPIRAPQWRLYGADAGFMALDDVNPLILPVYRAALASDIWRRFAPQFAIEQWRERPDEQKYSGVNRPGLPVRDSSGTLQWRELPVLFYYASVGRFQGRQTLQLNYQIWFSARPASKALDLLAGKLDGLLWRVHLDDQLKPLAYDAMHNCGCWYQLFPAKGYLVSQSTDYWQEPVFIGPSPELPNPTLLVAADTHSVVGLRAPVTGASALKPVQLSPAMVGSRQPLTSEAKAHRRIFSNSGRVLESARAERWLFWPMGVPAAGSMRAPGHHAIAFAGRRHFDQSDLLDLLGLQKMVD